MGSSDEVAAAGDRLEGRPPEEILAWASERYAPRLTFATGFGPEGVALIDLIARHHLPVDLFTLDTGLFFPETYALWRRLEDRYGLTIRAVKPAQTVDEQQVQHGPALWERNPDRCCELRKVQPLRRALEGFDAWVTAIRRDQTDSRSSARVVEWDAKFGLVKVNPLAAWTTRDVWRYLQGHQVPYNPLHDRGYASIGCWPCTTPLLAGESGREGRWRGRVKTECGLHLAQPPAPEGNPAMPLVAPHGGTLVDRIAPPEQAAALRARAEALPALKLDARELADLELIAVGAVSPLTGYLGSKDYRSVLDSLRLANGTVWPVPLTLALDESVRARVRPGGEVALKDEQGRLWGTLAVSEVFERDPLDEARNVYRTESPEHPGVAYLLSRPRWLAAGEVTVLPLPADLPFAHHRLTPRQLRARIQEKGWSRVSGFQTRNPIHRAHEHLTKLALEFTDGLVIHPLVGETKGDDVPASVRFKVYEKLVETYYPPNRVLLAAFPAAMRYAGPREALFHALVRKNYGIAHLCVGRDHAGVGKFYGPLEAQQMFDKFTPEELGVSPLKFDPTFFCKVCGNLASTRTCPHGPESRVELSGSNVREILRSGATLPPEFTRPEIAEILRAHYTGGAVATPPAAPAAASGPQKGFILWFTGLSGAGKSTLANAVRDRLGPQRRVEILDGDEVRTYLSKGLGFSKEDRDTNIRRIGYVARVLARNGVAVITAAISPYAAIRDEVRKLAEGEGIPFVEVFAQAELDALVKRDVKGLYKKALAGEVQHFTGVSDPYEAPEKPEVVCRSDKEPVDESVARILAALEGRGLVTGLAKKAA